MSHLNLWRSNDSAHRRSNAQSTWDFFAAFESELSPFLGTVSRTRQKTNRPECDVNENENEYLLSFDVPGLAREDIEIDITESTLTVSGERKNLRDSAERNVHRIERSFGKFERSFELPQGTVAEEIKAGYENGVLELLIPKPEKIKPHKVSITAKGLGLNLNGLNSTKQKTQKETKLAN